MHRETFSTRTYETDFNNRLRVSSVLNYMQEVAANNANELGFGFSDFTEQGLFWVLSRVKIVIDSYPFIGEPFIVETWPKKLNKLFALRDFRFFDLKGEIRGVATTAWLIVNRETLRPVRPEGIMQDIRREEGEHAIEAMPEKLAGPKELVQVKEINVAYSDIDVNQHVNNVKYMEYVLDSYPEEELRNSMINTLQINFLSECKFGDVIRIMRGKLDGKDYFEGLKVDGGSVFQVELSRING